MAKNFHNGTNILAKQDTIFLGVEILEFLQAPTVKTHLSVLTQKIPERKVWVIEKFWKYI